MRICLACGGGFSGLDGSPDEVQRKSTLNAERAAAEQLAERVARPARRTSGDIRPSAARIAQLWQTRILRFSKLNVAEEIENVLTYYRTTFLREIPRLYAALEEQLGGGIAPFFRMGNSNGGAAMAMRM